MTNVERLFRCESKVEIALRLLSVFLLFGENPARIKPKAGRISTSAVFKENREVEAYLLRTRSAFSS
jgi:hypothetical protein